MCLHVLPLLHTEIVMEGAEYRCIWLKIVRLAERGCKGHCLHAALSTKTTCICFMALAVVLMERQHVPEVSCKCKTKLLARPPPVWG